MAFETVSPNRKCAVVQEDPLVSCRPLEASLLPCDKPQGGPCSFQQSTNYSTRSGETRGDSERGAGGTSGKQGEAACGVSAALRTDVQAPWGGNGLAAWAGAGGTETSFYCLLHILNFI